MVSFTSSLIIIIVIIIPTFVIIAVIVVIIIVTYTDCFNGRFWGKSGFLVAPLILSLQSSILCFLTGQAKILHVDLDTIPPDFSQATRLSPLTQISWSNHFHVCPNHVNLALLVARQTGSIADNSLSSIFFYLSFNRVVSIAIQVSLLLVSAIHLEYRRKYCQYFLQQVSLTVSPILREG